MKLLSHRTDGQTRLPGQLPRRQPLVALPEQEAKHFRLRLRGAQVRQRVRNVWYYHTIVWLYRTNQRAGRAAPAKFRRFRGVSAAGWRRCASLPGTLWSLQVARRPPGRTRPRHYANPRRPASPQCPQDRPKGLEHVRRVFLPARKLSVVTRFSGNSHFCESRRDSRRAKAASSHPKAY